MEKKILGIDPGLSVTGYSVLLQKKASIFAVEYNFKKFSSKDDVQTRIGQFYEFILYKIDQHGITHLAIETPFLGKNAQTFLKLGYLRGVIYAIAFQRKLQVFEFSPTQVKQSITGYGGASKEQVAKVLSMLFPNMYAPAKADATDALAIGLCGIWSKEKTL
jgi:crossover junction endodeoxyribonuclease RuvC